MRIKVDNLNLIVLTLQLLFSWLTLGQSDTFQTQLSSFNPGKSCKRAFLLPTTTFGQLCFCQNPRARLSGGIL